MSSLNNNFSEFLKSPKKVINKTIRLERKFIRKIRHYPEGLAINVSALCNLRCVMCSLDTYGEHHNMSLETFRELEPAIRNAGFITLPIAGEAFVNKHILHMLKRIREISPAWLMITTNGTLITPSIAIEVVKYSVDVIRVSLDGIEPETNNHIRVRSNYEKILNSIRLLKEARERVCSKKPSIIISFCGMKSNIAEFPAVVELAGKLGIEGVWMVGLEPFFFEMKDMVLYGENQSQFKSYLNKAREIATRYNLDLRLPAFEISNIRKCKPQPHISATGDVSPCSRLMYGRKYFWLGEERQAEKLVLGNIRDKKLVEIWNQPDAINFRKQVEAGNFTKVCEGCLFSHNVIEKWF